MTNAQRAEAGSTAPVAVRPPSDPATHPDDGLARLRHDIRNALLPLLLHFDLLDLHARGLAPAAAASPDELRAHIRRLANGLLLRTTEHASQVSPGRLQLSQWWNQVGDLVGAPVRGDDALVVQLNPRLPAVVAHPAILAQVILHMLVNVRLSHPVRHRPIQISARRTSSGVALTIRHTADGLRLARTRAADVGASRWGMTLARSLLVACGGDVTGSSHADTGTHVVIRLQAAGAAKSIARTPQQRPSSGPPLELHAKTQQPPLLSAAPPEPHRPQRVLIIDDNAALTGALALRFEIDGGFTCVPPLHQLCDSANYIERHAPDIVLLDLNLPGDERPLDLLRTLQQRGSPVRVVVLTGNPSGSAVDATRAADGAGFIAKGVAPERLLAALRRVGQEPFVLELDT